MNRRRLPIIVVMVILLGSILVTGCENPEPEGAHPDIYVCGFFVNGNGDERACYWINGVRTDLSSPNNNANSRANQMVVSGSDLYFAGFYTSSTAGEGTIPCYWKNALCTGLGVTMGRSNGIFVDGTDVYVAGEYGSSPQIACYWKNDSAGRIDLPGTGSLHYDTGSCIYVDGTSIYVGGDYYDGLGLAYVPCRWEADKTTNIPAAVPYAPEGGNVNDITVPSPGTVIACGFSASSVAYYWQNATENILPYSGSTMGATAYALSMNGTDVYSAGYFRNSTHDIPCYWLNDGTAVPLDNPVGDDAAVFDIQYVAADDTLYSAGYYTDGSGDTVPCYWTGTTKHDLDGFQGRATGIVVIP